MNTKTIKEPKHIHKLEVNVYIKDTLIGKDVDFQDVYQRSNVYIWHCKKCPYVVEKRIIL